MLVQGDGKGFARWNDFNKRLSVWVSRSMELGFLQVGLRTRRVGKKLEDTFD